jgi:hypothetical protein
MDVAGTAGNKQSAVALFVSANFRLNLPVICHAGITGVQLDV